MAALSSTRTRSRAGGGSRDQDAESLRAQGDLDFGPAVHFSRSPFARFDTTAPSSGRGIPTSKRCSPSSAIAGTPAGTRTASCAWVMEHVRDAERAWANMADLLAPDGVALAFHPTLYAPPFVINWLIPDRLTAPVLKFFFDDRHDGEFPKFPARYNPVFLVPLGEVEEVVLLGPQHSRQRLPHHPGRVLADTRWCYCAVELVGLSQTALQHLRETAAERIANRVGGGPGQAKANYCGLSRPHIEWVDRCGLGPLQPRIETTKSLIPSFT